MAETLLPIGDEIILEGRSLHILKRLGAGLTSEVYQAEFRIQEDQIIPVAVKAMKDLAFPMAKELFLQESQFLRQLMDLEDEANRQQNVSFKIAPLYYGRGRHLGTPYIVEEYIDGTEIPKLLEEQGRFPEYQALTAAWHLYRTLDILHAGLGRTYIDLKFEDLWWVSSGENPSDGQLKITDLGTLEEIKEGKKGRRAIRRDVLLAAVYLFAMLTGYRLDYLIGELREDAEPHLRQHRANISWGTYQLLRKLLHRNAEARPDNAVIVMQELSALIEFWEQSASELINTADVNVLEAERDPESDQAVYYARRALSALDIATLKGQPYDQYRYQDHKERAEKILSISDYLERAKGFFRAGSYELARKLCQEGVHWSDEPAELRRWAYLSMVGEEVTISKEQRQAAMEAVDVFSGGDLKAAGERLRALLPDLESPGMTALLSDLQLSAFRKDALKAQEPRQEDFRRAAQSYRQAMEMLEKLPDAEFVRREETGDLLADAERMERLAETRQQAEEKMKAANDILQKLLFRREEAGKVPAPVEDQQSLQQALSLAAQAFELDRENPQRFTGLQKLAEAALSIGEFSFAAQFSEIGLNAPRFAPEDLAVLNISRQLREAETALEMRDAEGFQATIRACWEEFSVNPHVRPAILYLLERAAKKSRSADESRLAKVVAELYKILGEDVLSQRMLDVAENIHRNRTKRLRSTVDDLINDATRLLRLDDPEFAADQVESRLLVDVLQRLRDRKGRLKEIADLLDDAERVGVSMDYRVDEINALKERLITIGNATHIQVQRVDAENDRALPALTTLWQDIDQVKGEARLVALCDFVARCYAYLNHVDPSSEEVKGWIYDATQQLDQWGAQGWQQLQQKATRHLDLLAQDFEKLQTAFESGQDAQVAAELTRLTEKGFGESSEWNQLKVRLAQVQSWRTWHEIHAGMLESGGPNAGLLADLRNFAALEIPAPYWQATALAYLQRVRQNIREVIWPGIRGAQISPDFLGYLRVWLETAWTEQVVSGRSHDDATAWNTELFLREVCLAARADDLGYLDNVVENVPSPPDIHTTLAGLTSETWQKVVREVENEITVSEKRFPWRKVFAGAAAALLGLYVVLSAASIGFFLTRPMQAGSIVRSSTPTFNPTPIPSVTLMPTATLQPTSTPLPTLTPTSHSSRFLLLPQIEPPAPVSADGLWILDADSAIAAPPFSDAEVWLVNEQENSYYTTSGDVFMVWEMDAPLPTGYYQLFVLDTLTFSGGEQKFNVHLDGQEEEPFFGVNHVIFNTVQYGEQEKADWLSIGIYQLSHGQKLSVQAEVGPRTSEQPFSVSRLLIVKIPDDRLFMLLERGLPRERKLVSLLDDDRTTIYSLDVNGNPFDPYRWENPWGVVTDEQSWRKSFLMLNQPWDRPVIVEWYPVGRQLAGRYELYVWVPAEHATVLADFDLLADGRVVERVAPAQLNQIDWNAEWVSLGIWDLSAEAAVGVRMSISTENPGEIGVDAVALVRIDN